jgi:hypothetical protein
MDGRVLLARSLSDTPAAAARTPVEATDVERNAEAWNLPRAPRETGAREAPRAHLEWQEFVAAHFPNTRRHNLAAIVAYGVHRSANRSATESGAGA